MGLSSGVPNSGNSGRFFPFSARDAADGHGLAKHPRDSPSLTSPEVAPWHGSQVSVLDGERGGGLSRYYVDQKCKAHVQK